MASQHYQPTQTLASIGIDIDIEANCKRLMSIPGVEPMISTAVVAAIGTGEAFERGRDFGAWLGLVPMQYSTGG